MEEPKFIIPNSKISSLRKFGSNKEHVSFYITDRSSTKLKVKKFNILNSPLNKIFDNYENINLSFFFYIIKINIVITNSMSRYNF